MSRCIIIAPLYAGEAPELVTPAPGDLLICADGGYDAACRFGLKPDLVIGDFDSMPRAHVQGVPVETLPVRKDDTDMVVCLRRGREAGYRSFVLAGCLGGRFDHSLANLQCLYDCALRGEEAWMADALNRVRVLTPGHYTFEAVPGDLLSLLAFTPEVKGITLTGTRWPLTDAGLTARFPLGCSNEALADTVTLSFTAGALVFIRSVDPAKKAVNPC